jgi:hypothetical protein
MKIIEFFRKYKNFEKFYLYTSNLNEKYLLNFLKSKFITKSSIKNSKELLKNLFDFNNKILANNSRYNRTTIDNDATKLFIEIKVLFYPNQLITIISDFRTLISILQNFAKILIDLKNVQFEKNNLNILWIPENNIQDYKVHETDLKSLLDLKSILNVYILNWMINMDKVVNRLTSYDNDEQEIYYHHQNNCQIEETQRYCDTYSKLNEIGNFLILKFDDFILKNKKYTSSTSFESYIIDNSELVLKLSNDNVFILNKQVSTNPVDINKPEIASYRVVSLNIEPFLIASGTDCQDGLPCLELNTHENFYETSNISDKTVFVDKLEQILKKENLKMLINDFNKDSKNFHGYDKASKKCCTGYIVNILQKLSQDLNINFDLYITPDNHYGKYNKSWSGPVNHIVNDVADMIAGPFSITEERAKFVDYTTVFLSSGYSLLIKQDYNTYDVFMFMKPFTFLHWALIIMCTFVSAIALSLLEFNSPFGLNPRGRQRARNYTLGSAISMVISLMFMHTMPAKSPKSWAGKWVFSKKKGLSFYFEYYFFCFVFQTQNFIAGFALFFIATYTAQMASILSLGHDSKVFKGFEDNDVNLKIKLKI